MVQEGIAVQSMLEKLLLLGSRNLMIDYVQKTK